MARTEEPYCSSKSSRFKVSSLISSGLSSFTMLPNVPASTVSSLLPHCNFLLSAPELSSLGVPSLSAPVPPALSQRTTTAPPVVPAKVLQSQTPGRTPAQPPLAFPAGRSSPGLCWPQPWAVPCPWAHRTLSSEGSSPAHTARLLAARVMSGPRFPYPPWTSWPRCSSPWWQRTGLVGPAWSFHQAPRWQ